MTNVGELTASNKHLSLREIEFTIFVRCLNHQTFLIINFQHLLAGDASTESVLKRLKHIQNTVMKSGPSTLLLLPRQSCIFKTSIKI